MELAPPSQAYKQSYISYIEELGNEERYPFTLDLDFNNFPKLLKQLEEYSMGKNLPKDTVQNTTLWLIESKEIIGVTNLRHCLNEKIRYCGGHIGMSIRPSKRGIGLGNQLMRLSIEHLTQLGLKEINIHCYKSNTNSAKTIINNGGILDSEITENNNIVQRYVRKNT